MKKLEILVKFLAILSLFGFQNSAASKSLDADISDIVFNKGAINSIISAYGDFNSDEITDVFMLSSNNHIIDIYLGKNFFFSS